MEIRSFIRGSMLTVLVMLSSAMCHAQLREATVRISAKNVAGYNLTYSRSYNGVWLSRFTPAELDSDSVFVLKMPTDGIERLTLMAHNPNKDFPSAFKTFYVVPGLTEVTIDPLAADEKDKIVVSSPSGNPLDGNIADVDTTVYNLWFNLVAGQKDQLGLKSDTIPTSVTAKIDAFVDSVVSLYRGASPELADAALRDARLCALMIYQSCYYMAKLKNQHILQWDKELARMKNEIDMTNPANARNPHFGEVMIYAFSLDVNPGTMSPDSMLRLRSDYALSALDGKTAEAIFGGVLYEDGEKKIFSPSAPALTEKFKSLFPNSGLIPILDKQIKANREFNNPTASDEVVFLDNSSLKTLDQLFAAYKGKPVLIDVWATWCGPCRKSFEHVKPIQEYAAENGLQLLYISIDEGDGVEERWKNMAKYYDLKGHHVIINPDFKQEVFDTFGENSYLYVPCYATIDRNGTLTVLGSDLAESSDFVPLREILDKIK